MICHRCNGKGQIFGFINTGLDSSRHFSGYVNCSICLGSGQLNDEAEKWIKDGRALLERRRSLGKSLLEASQLMGISPAELSSIENGAKPVPRGIKL